MVLDLGDDIENLFPHSKEFDQGLGKERPGQNVLVVSQDGSGDFDKIEEALKAAIQGNTIYIKEGTYVLSGLTIDKSDITLEGSGKNTILNAKAASTLIIQATSKSGIIIRRLSINVGNATAGRGVKLTTCTNSIIENCWIDASAGRGVEILTDCSTIIIRNNIITKGSEPIYIIDSRENLIEGNLINGNNSVESAIVLTGTSGNLAEYNIITNNIIKDCLVVGIFLLQYSGHNIISGNISKGNDETGIAIQAGSTGNILVNNICLDNDYANIINSGTDTQLSHNITS